MKRQIFWKVAFLHCRLCLTIAPCAYNSAPLHTCTLARTSHDETQKSMAGFLWLSDID
jgi:hypothetical protein